MVPGAQLHRHRGWPGTPGTPVLAPTRGYSTFHPWEFIHFDWSAVPDAVT
jgi:hypothetical protein